MTKKKSVFRMMVITVLLGIGMNFHHPVTPTLYTAMELPSRIFGTSMAVMCFFSFLTSVFWGEFSNHIGQSVYDFLRVLWPGAAEPGLFCE